MAPENKSKTSKNNNKKRKNYLPHNKPVKKGAYPLRPGVEGFFITCDGGREYQAANEAISVIESYFEELVDGRESKFGQSEVSKKPMNKIIKFDSSSSDEDDEEEDANGDQSKEGHDVHTKEDEKKPIPATSDDVTDDSRPQNEDTKSVEKQTEGNNGNPENPNDPETKAVEQAAKKQCVETADVNRIAVPKKVEEKSVDKLIEEELAELGDKSKRRFNKLETGCNGVVFIQMRKKEKDPSPKEIVQHMMTSLSSNRKHVSRFLLRVLPIEASCYTSDEEINRAIKPLMDMHFPVETENPRKFAVLYEARANTGIDKAKIINTVAKAVPAPHKVDLSNPDINIVVQICKTVCLIGIVEKYKEMAKYNVRQLTSTEV